MDCAFIRIGESADPGLDDCSRVESVNLSI